MEYTDPGWPESGFPYNMAEGKSKLLENSYGKFKRVVKNEKAMVRS